MERAISRGKLCLALCLGVAFVVFGCQRYKDAESEQTTVSKIVLSVSTESESSAESRLNMDQIYSDGIDEVAGISLSWHTSSSYTDKFSVYSQSGEYVGDFTYIGEDGAKSGDFIQEGEFSMADGNYTAVFPAVDPAEFPTLESRNSAEFKTLTQTLSSSLDHIEREIRMVADFTLQSNSAAPFSFNHEQAIFTLDVTMPAGVIAKGITMIDERTVSNSYKLDVDHSSVIPGTSGSVRLSLPIAADPQGVAGEIERNIEFIAVGANGGLYRQSVSTIKSYSAGAQYRGALDFSTVEQQEPYITIFTGTMPRLNENGTELEILVESNVECTAEISVDYARLIKVEYLDDNQIKLIVEVDANPTYADRHFTIVPKSIDGSVQASWPLYLTQNKKQDETLSNDLSHIFVDATYSELLPTVTQEQIDGIVNDIFRGVAQGLLDGTYRLDRRLFVAKPHMAGEIYQSLYDSFAGSELDNATGIYVNRGDEIILYCEEFDGVPLQLYIVDYTNSYLGVNQAIEGGKINVVRAPINGVIYVDYPVYSPYNLVNHSDIKMHFFNGAANGVFRAGVTSNSEWSTMLSEAKGGHMDIQGENAHWVAPVDKLQAHVEDPTALIRAYDELVRLINEFAGLYKHETYRLNRRLLFSGVGSGYMYATHYLTWYNPSTLGTILNAEKIAQGEHIWGPAHEIGHTMQMDPSTNWIGTTETTTNLFSLYVQTSLGAQSRLIGERRYYWAFNSLLTSTTKSNMDAGIWECLTPLWQVHLLSRSLSGANGDTYMDMHDYFRNNTPPAGEGANQLEFAVQASLFMGYDLTEFFQRWGFFNEIDRDINDYKVERFTITKEMADAAKARISHLPKIGSAAIWYITDENKDLYRDPQPATISSVELVGTEVVITGASNVAAFEIWNGSEILKIDYGTSTAITAPTGYSWSGSGLTLRAVAIDGSTTDYRIM